MKVWDEYVKNDFYSSNLERGNRGVHFTFFTSRYSDDAHSHNTIDDLVNDGCDDSLVSHTGSNYKSDDFLASSDLCFCTIL